MGFNVEFNEKETTVYCSDKMQYNEAFEVFKKEYSKIVKDDDIPISTIISIFENHDRKGFFGSVIIKKTILELDDTGDLVSIPTYSFILTNNILMNNEIDLLNLFKNFLDLIIKNFPHFLDEEKVKNDFESYFKK
ncbi:MAG: hypothetical protein PHT94_00870 [Candidatus Nanoarchaeia archaeon]|nr:hypothetical protein [Candidatus Nanoarchaeia archaeon]